MIGIVKQLTIRVVYTHMLPLKEIHRVYVHMYICMVYINSVK